MLTSVRVRDTEYKEMRYSLSDYVSAVHNNELMRL